MTVREAGERSGYTIKGIHRAIEKGGLRARKRHPGRRTVLHIEPRDLERWLASANRFTRRPAFSREALHPVSCPCDDCVRLLRRRCLGVWLTQDVMDDVERVAGFFNMSRSELVRTAVEIYLEEVRRAC